METTLDEAGRIPLPPDLQARLGLKPGDPVVLEEQGGRCILRAARLPEGLRWEGNLLVHEGVSPVPLDDDLVRQDREARLDYLSKGVPE